MIEASANNPTPRTIVKNARKPGERRSTEYGIWAGMKGRCRNPNFKDWKNYGGRGITFCERWEIFENFYEDMGPRPSPLHTLDRKDNSLGYSKENCRWATWSEQQNNRSSNHIVEFNGERKTISEWENKLGWKQGTLKARLQRGWDITKSLTAPVFQAGLVEFRGKIKTIHEWANEIGCKHQMLGSRLRRGWSIEEAMTISIVQKGQTRSSKKHL